MLVRELRSLVWLCRWHNGRKEKLEELYQRHFSVFCDLALQEIEGIPTGEMSLDLAGFSFAVSCDGESMTILAVEPPETISGRQLDLFSEVLEDDEFIEEIVEGDGEALTEEQLERKLQKRKEVMLMAERVEESLKVAICLSPREYGLSIEDVNPLALYLLSKDEMTVDEAWNKCSKIVSEKSEEVMRMLEDFVEFRKEYASELESKSASAEEPPEEGGGEGPITHRQIRYLGYLYRQLGQEPDYESIRKLTRADATREISRLEKEAGVEKEEKPKKPRRKAKSSAKKE